MTDMTAAQVRMFFSAVWSPPDIVEVRAIWPERKSGKAPRSLWRAAGEWAGGADADWLDGMNAEGWNLYAGVLPRMAKGARGNASALPGAALWADIDHATREEAAPRLEAGGLPAPSILVNTGHGVQCYWLLTEKRQPAELRALVGDIAALLKSDPAVCNEERVLRIPGFVNHKPPAADAELLECDPERCFEYEEIRAIVPTALSKHPPAAPAPSCPVAAFGRNDGTMERARRYLATVPGSGPGGRTNTAFRVAAVLVRDYALDEATALDLLTRWDGAANSPPIQGDPQYGPDELVRIIRNAGRYGKHGVGELLNAPRADDGFDMGAFIANCKKPVHADEEETAPDRIADPGPFPERLLRVGGFLGEFSEYINRRAVKRQPVISLAAAIATLGTLAGRKVEGVTGLRTNFYVLGVAESGDGKDKPREVARQLLYESGNNDLYSSDRLKSDAGIRSALEANPCTLFLLDEIGEMLETIKNARNSPWLKNIITELLTLYSSAQSHGVKLGGYADAKKTVTVDCPHVCLFGTSVPKSIFRSMTMDSISGGLMARLLIFESATENPRKQTPAREPIPAGVALAAKWWREFRPGGGLTGNFAGSASAPMLVDESAEAKRIFDDAEERAREEVERLPAEYASPYKRVEENARKLALLAACSENRSAPHIGSASAAWGADLAFYLTRRLVYLASVNVSENDVHDRRNRVLKLIADSGEKGLSKSELLRKCRYLGSRGLDEILDTLVKSEEVEAEEIKTSGRSRILFRERSEKSSL